MFDRLFVLVVDDDTPSARLLTRYLDALGYASEMAHSGEEALSILGEHPRTIGLVFLDLAMPGISGYDVCRAIRSDPELSLLPVVAITANVEAEYMQLAQEAGVNHLITKPFSRDELEAALNTYFGSRQTAE